MKNEKRSIAPLISTGGLANNLAHPKMVVIDIRSSEEYKTGHIPAARNIPFPAWITAKGDLLVELPEETYLCDMLGTAGITPDSIVVIVNKTDHPYPLADAARVAATLLYVGIQNVAILDGGYNKWVKEGKTLSQDVPEIKPARFSGETDKEIFVIKDYVLEHIGKSVILDNRDPSVYFGISVEPTAKRGGHIPGARCLPAPWIWTAEGTYHDITILRDMAYGVISSGPAREIVVYCGVGGYASAWWFVLTQLLGYENVKLYDGSAQEWTLDAKMPLTSFKWE
jgi:thiosulfate/3-mercaptopyruvate sulfurtransferase